MEILIASIFLLVLILLAKSIQIAELERKSIFERIENNNREIERLLCEIKRQNYQITTAFRVSNEDEPK